MGLEQSGALLSFLWWEGTQQPKRLVKASTAPRGYRSMQEAPANSSSLKYVPIWWVVRHDHSCAQRHWADSPDVQLVPAQVGKRSGSSRARHSNYQLWQDISLLSAGNEKSPPRNSTKHQLIFLCRVPSQQNFSCTGGKKFLWRWEFSTNNPVGTKFERGSVLPSKQQF